MSAKMLGRITRSLVTPALRSNTATGVARRSVGGMHQTLSDGLRLSWSPGLMDKDLMANYDLPRSPGACRPSPLLHYVPVNDGIRLAVTEWRPLDEQAVPTVCVFLHAIGFHGRYWDQVIRSLPPNAHCYAIDVRGHGRSDKPDPIDGVYPWQTLAADVKKVLRHFRVQNAVGIGHSLGGYLLLSAAVGEPSCFRALLAVDPCVLKAKQYGDDPDTKKWNDAMAGVAHRFNAFASVNEMYKRFHGKGPFQVWRSECLLDYCTYGLLPASDFAGAGTGWTATSSNFAARSKSDEHMCLACPPHIEAATYAGIRGHSELDRYKEIDVPVVILRAEFPSSANNKRHGGKEGCDFSASPTDPECWKNFRNGKDVHLKDGMTHFIPMQKPEVVVEHVMNLMQGDQLTSYGLTSNL